MEFSSTLAAGTTALTRGLEDLQRNADQVAKLQATNDVGKEEVVANAEVGVTNLKPAITQSANKPVGESARVTELLVEQKEILASFEAAGNVVGKTQNLLDNLL